MKISDTDVKLTILDASHLPQMAELYRSAFHGEPWNDDWSDTEQLMEYIKEISGSYHALNYGLFINGELIALSIGMIRHWWEGTNYNIEEFCVATAYQGQADSPEYSFRRTMTSRRTISIRKTVLTSSVPTSAFIRT